MLLSSSTLAETEGAVARVIVEFSATPPAQRASWLAEHFGPDYPPGSPLQDTVQDIITRAVNAAPFASTFVCPACERLALAPPPARDRWQFFVLE